MKKLTFLSLLLVFASLVNAQIYFRAGGGYALPLATQGAGQKNMTVQNGNGATLSATSELVKASYGAGVNFNLGAGYMFSKHIGAELNFSYLLGKEFESSTTVIEEDESIELVATTKSKAIYITPALVISAGEGSKVPYAKLGVVMGVPQLDQKLTISMDGTDGTNTATGNYKYQKGMSFGFMGAVGMNWMVSNNIDILTEINFISMTYYPKEYVLTSLVSNGEKQDLDDFDEYDKKTIFKEKIDVVEDPDQDEPREALQESMPFSSISFQVGIVYFLGRNLD